MGPHASAGLSFDQFDQDETVTLGYGEENHRRAAGLNIADRPDEPLQAFAESTMAIRAMPDGPAKEPRMRRFRLESRHKVILRAGNDAQDGLSGAPVRSSDRAYSSG